MSHLLGIGRARYFATIAERVVSPLALRGAGAPDSAGRAECAARDLSRRLPPAGVSPHIAAMAKSGRPAARAKARRPDVHPLGEHLAALLNPALVDRPAGFGEASRPRSSRRSRTRIRAA
jgi:hypothetical protein